MDLGFIYIVVVVTVFLVGMMWAFVQRAYETRLDEHVLGAMVAVPFLGFILYTFWKEAFESNRESRSEVKSDSKGGLVNA